MRHHHDGELSSSSPEKSGKACGQQQKQPLYGKAN